VGAALVPGHRSAELAKAAAPNWKNQQAERSPELAPEYSQAGNIHLILPTPFILNVSHDDVSTPTDLAIEALHGHGSPSTGLHPGRRFDAYVGRSFQHASTPASTGVHWTSDP